MAKTDSRSNFGVRGWIFVIYSFLTLFFTTATGDSISNLALPALCEKYGWVYENMVSWKSVFGWMNVIVMAALGQVMKKFSPKIGATCMAAIYTICVFLIPNTSTKALFIILYGIMCIGALVWGEQLNGIITSNWFPRKKGLVIGWTTAGFPLGSGLGVMLYNIISQGGQHMNRVFYVYGGVLVLLTLTVAFVLTSFPEECGCFPDNDRSMTREQADAILAEGLEASKNSIWTSKKMLSTKWTWLIGISNGFALFFAGTMSVMIPRLMAAGYSMQQAIPMMTITAILGGVGSYIMGVIDTKIGPKRTIMLMHILAICAGLLGMIPGKGIHIYICMVFSGMVLGASANMLLSLISTMWGRYSFVNAYAILLPINQFIGSCGTITIAQIAARYSYNGAYAAVSVVALIGLLLIIPVKEDAIKKIEQAEGYVRPEAMHDAG